MLTNIVEAITSFVTGMISLVVDSVNAATGLFWDATLNTGAGGLTTFGTLALIGMGMGLLALAFNFVRGLIR